MYTLVQFVTGYFGCVSSPENRKLSNEVILDISKSVVTVSGVGNKPPKQAIPLKYDVIDRRNKILEIVLIFWQKPL